MEGISVLYELHSKSHWSISAILALFLTSLLLIRAWLMTWNLYNSWDYDLMNEATVQPGALPRVSAVAPETFCKVEKIWML
jgi:membrane protein YdbS with pleckstrin-like domain